MRLVGESGGMTMRLTSILIITGAVLAVAQAAVAQLTTIPITVTSQTLTVRGFGMTTGPVSGGSSVGTPWNFGNEDGSTAGSVTSELIAGELVITVSGAVSKGSTTGKAELNFELIPLLGFVVPDYGTPIFLQLTNVNRELIGLAELGYMSFRSDGEPFPGAYSSQLLGGLVSLGYAVSWGEAPATSISIPLTDLIPNDTVAIGWSIYRSFRQDVDSSTGTFSETYTLRVITPVPEPSASLSIPSGVGMLLALAKLRGVSLVH